MESLSHIWVYLALAISSILNILVPISGSATVTPFLALLTDPHTAIGLASFYFFLSALIRIVLFRKDIDWKEVRLLFFPSVIMAVMGAYAVKFLPDRTLLVVMLLFAIYFFLKKLNVFDKKKASSFTSYVVGLLSGFLQGAGLAGSDLRNVYLYGQNLNIPQVHGTTAVMGAANFLVATAIRLQTEQLTLPDLTPFIYIFPIMLVSMLIGRRLLYKVPERVSHWVIVITMALIIVFLGVKAVGI